MAVTWQLVILIGFGWFCVTMLHVNGPQSISFAHWPSFIVKFILKAPIFIKASLSVLAHFVAACGHVFNSTGGIPGEPSWPVWHCNAKAKFVCYISTYIRKVILVVKHYTPVVTDKLCWSLLLCTLHLTNVWSI